MQPLKVRQHFFSWFFVLLSWGQEMTMYNSLRKTQKTISSTIAKTLSYIQCRFSISIGYFKVYNWISYCKYSVKIFKKKDKWKIDKTLTSVSSILWLCSNLKAELLIKGFVQIQAGRGTKIIFLQRHLLTFQVHQEYLQHVL